MSFTFCFFFFFQAEDGIRDAQESRGLGDVYKRQPHTPADPPQPSRLAWPSRRTVCLLLLILAATLAANFWVGILRNTFNDLSSAVGVPQHDFYQYYAGGHNWNLGLDPYLNYPCLLYTSDAADE